MMYRYNKVKRFTKWGLVLCLLALLPQSAKADVVEYYGTYGIGISYDHYSWHEKYYAEEGLDRTVAGFQGNGTLESPYLINTVWDLCRLEDLVNAGNCFTNQYFRLEEDLDLSASYYAKDQCPLWYPIGVNNEFKGNFDGNGHTIDYMRILIGDRQSDSPMYAYGLFGYSGGVIKNVKMTNAYVTFGQSGTYNKARYLFAGLLCGYLYHYPDDQCYGAIYGCNVQGRFYGWPLNAEDSYSNTHLGGVVGFAANPVSIYQCHANLTADVSCIGSLGGIVGVLKADYTTFPIENDTENSLAKPRESYVFDCTAHFEPNDEGNKADGNVGGICGQNERGHIVACAATGDITSYGGTLGGIVGFNCRTVIDCVSMVTLHGSTTTTMGGVAGNNDTETSTSSCNVFNCVFSGHLDGDRSPNAYGLVGAGKVIPNALFLGTRVKNEDCPSDNPLWNSTTTVTSYSDANLYHGESDYSAYKDFSKITSGESNDTEFSTMGKFHRWWTNNRNGDDIDISIIDVWRFREGFYPRLQVGSSNIVNGTTEALLKLHDYVIERAATKFGDDKATLTTPKLFPQYAWLASVPAFTHDGQWASFFDTALSLAQRKMTDNQSNIFTANYELIETAPSVMTVTGTTATPKANMEGTVTLRISTLDGVSKELAINVNGHRKWDGVLAPNFDGGNGSEERPYLIHDARQLLQAFQNNKENEYYRLVNDIWVNENLLTTDGNVSANAAAWDHEANNNKSHWKGHLDGNGHLIRGLYTTNAFGLLESMDQGASIENTGFVDCAVNQSPNYNNFDRAFLTPVMWAKTVLRNCLLDGLYLYNGSGAYWGGICSELRGSDNPDDFGPTIEDCVVAVCMKGYKYGSAIFNRLGAHKVSLRRILILNNSHSTSMENNNVADKYDCFAPVGYLNKSYDYWDAHAKSVDDMTNGTFFTGDGFEKWTVKQGRFPMLKTFAETPYGKLISLPIYTDKDNRLDKMNYLLDFTPANATWQSSDNTILDVDADIRVIEPKVADNSAWLVRSLDGVKVLTPITTDESIIAGIKFEDPEAKEFCVAHYDDNGDGEVSLAELKNVTLEELEADMNEADGDASDNDGELIELFPEFRYFAGITDLGTSFQEKDKLKTLEFSGKITELSDDDFKGNTSMTQMTIPTSITSVSGKAFYNSGLENYSLEADHTTFAVADGLLFNKDKDQLLSFPSGRKNTSITIPDNVKTIASNAVYKMSALEQVYIDAPDYDYETVVALDDNAFTPADGKNITYYIEDATQDYEDTDDDEGDEPADARLHSARRAQTTDGNGKGHLVSKYQESEFWVDKPIKRYFTLEVSEKGKDANGYYWATMYIGFDTQLPEGLTAYIVDKEKTKESESTLVLREISNKVRMMTPVVIRATKAGPYKLYASEESKRYPLYPMSENLLEGVNRKGLQVYQSDSNDGGCLTLGRNASGQVGFFIYKGTAKIPAFRAYLTVNKVGNANSLLFSFADDETTGVNSMSDVKSQKSDVWYDVQGHKLDSKPTTKGIYINNGRKYVIK